MIKLLEKVNDDIIYNLLSDTKHDCMIYEEKESTKKLILQYQSIGTIVAVIDDGTTLCISGVSRIHSGVAIAWGIISMKFLKKPILMVKVGRNFMNKSMIDLNLHRIHMDIDRSKKENIRFAESLRFKCESIMHHYGPEKQDYCRYALLRD